MRRITFPFPNPLTDAMLTAPYDRNDALDTRQEEDEDRFPYSRDYQERLAYWLDDNDGATEDDYRKSPEFRNDARDYGDVLRDEASPTYHDDPDR